MRDRQTDKERKRDTEKETLTLGMAVYAFKMGFCELKTS